MARRSPDLVPPHAAAPELPATLEDAGALAPHMNVVGVRLDLLDGRLIVEDNDQTRIFVRDLFHKPRTPRLTPEEPTPPTPPVHVAAEGGSPRPAAPPDLREFVQDLFGDPHL